MRRFLLALVLTALSCLNWPAHAADVPGWTAVTCGCGRALSVDVVDANRAYLGTDAGVMRSDNGGWTWQALPFPVSGDVTQLSFADRDHGGAAGGFEGIAVTSDGGQTWEQQRPWAGPTFGLVALPDRWYALADDGLYTSTDGKNWTKRPGWAAARKDAAVEFRSPAMSWSDERTGVIAAPSGAWTTTDGGRSFTFAPLTAAYVFDALSLDSTEALVTGNLSARSGVPWVTRIEASRERALALNPRGAADEQVRGLARADNTYYAVGVDGLLARSTDAGRTWTYEPPPQSYETSDLYAVDALDAEHAIVAVYGGRVLLRNASTEYDTSTHPSRGAGTLLLVLAVAGAGGAVWALATHRPKGLVAGLVGATLAATVPGVLLITTTETCSPSGCDPLAAPSGDGDGRVAPPTAAPTPSASATPTPTASPTPSPTPARTPSPTPSPTAAPSLAPLPAFTLSPQRQTSTCDVNGNTGVPTPVEVTLSNTTAVAISWTARAREAGWGTSSPDTGTVAPGGSQVVTITPAVSECEPGGSGRDRHVDVQYGLNGTQELTATVFVQPQG